MLHPVVDWLTLKFASGARRAAADSFAPQTRAAAPLAWLDFRGDRRVLRLVYGVYRDRRRTVATCIARDYFMLLRSAGLTFLRVNLALIHRRALDRARGRGHRLQPALCAHRCSRWCSSPLPFRRRRCFRSFLLFLIRLRGGVEIAAMAADAARHAVVHPVQRHRRRDGHSHGSEGSRAVFSGSARLDRWRYLILPGIFPYLVTGMVTASGGAWNASIVAEYFHFQGRIVQAPGLGSTISSASDAGHFDLLLASTLIMATIVVLINRLVWRRLYRLASTRFKLEIARLRCRKLLLREFPAQIIDLADVVVEVHRAAQEIS